MKNNQRGVTLIALVVTIVVLLILAGTAIAMLSGDDGIMTNANKSQAANTEGEVREKIKLAYSAVKTEISVQSALNSSYNAQTSKQTLFLIAAREMGIIDSSVISGTNYSSADFRYTIVLDGNTIYFQYTDNKFGGNPTSGTTNTVANVKAAASNAGTTQQIQINGSKVKLKNIKANIPIATDGATLNIDAAQVVND